MCKYVRYNVLCKLELDDFFLKKQNFRRLVRNDHFLESKSAPLKDARLDTPQNFREYMFLGIVIQDSFAG